MRIVVLGAKGRLGRALCQVLPADAIALGRDAADLTKPAELRQTLTAHAPQVVINAAGYTDVDRAELEPKIAFAVNGMAMRDLATICRDLDCTLVHFSTDYVFGVDASRDTPYNETDKPGPINRYGRTKLDGEMFVRNLCKKHFLLRSGPLYGSDGPRSDYVSTLLADAAMSKPIRAVTDQTCTPTFVLDLANVVPSLLRSDSFGLYHVTNAGACTWHEFAQAVLAIRGIDVPVTAMTTQEFGAKAMRPRYSVLDCGKWTSTGFAPLRPWRDALTAALIPGPAS